MPSPRPSVVLFVDHVTRLADFYRQVAGMAQVHADAQHVVLEAHGLELVLHALPGSGARETPAPPAPREDSFLKPCFPVDDLPAARATARRLGGHLAGPEREWEARGVRACDGWDPEGNVFQLRVAAS